jgi:hypothetical protein
MVEMKRIQFLVILAAVCSFTIIAQTQQNVGDIPDGNKSNPVHLIKIYDEFDHLIKPDDTPLMPYSPRQTCRKCHDYEIIRHGWHFNAADSGVNPGRVGEPWIYVDPQSATQIPLSYRRWPGTYLPDAIGMSTFKYLTTFGRHLPGGGVGEKESAQDLNDYMRWQVSGTLDVNCQSCHNTDPAQSQAEYGVQVLRQNFRWAAGASSGFATVQGSAGEMPDNYDLYSAVPPEKSEAAPPSIVYNKSRFDVAGRVLFGVPRRMSVGQCLFCHSSKVIGPTRTDRWEGEEDVHLAAGMLCIDCHRAGLDHQMVRGYETEAQTTGRPAVASLTCKGCHLGSGEAGGLAEVRRRAPFPLHLGIPPVHFEKLACTACHSGTSPAEITSRVKTSRAHALGIPKADKADDALPFIATPVFAKQTDGTYAPHNVVWPAFWAFRKHEEFVPIIPTVVRPLITEVLGRDTTRIIGRWPVLRESEILAVLHNLQKVDSSGAIPIYVNGGKVFEIASDGKLASVDNEIAKPYMWPIAHDVRPKALSLGARGCDDCHSTSAPFYFGSVAVGSPFAAIPDSMTRMTVYEDKNIASAWLFSMSFLFRPGLKTLIIVCFFLIASVLLVYFLRGLAQIMRKLAEEEQ